MVLVTGFKFLLPKPTTVLPYQNMLPPMSDRNFLVARMIPRMCLPSDHCFYERTHRSVFEYIEHDCLRLLPPDDSDDAHVERNIPGSELRARFPEIPSGLEIRPGGQYAVVKVRH